MRDVKDWIKDIKAANAPDLWATIEERSAAPRRAPTPPPASRPLAAAVLVTATLLVGGVLYGLRDVGRGPASRPPGNPTTVTSSSPSPTGDSEQAGAFVPPTRTEGDRTVLPVVFPDGSTAELTYPPSLGLARLGVRPHWAACGRDVDFHYDDPRGTLYVGAPIETWEREDGQVVGLHSAVDRDVGLDGKPFVYLIFHFGDWTVDVYDYGGAAAMSEQEREACATGLSARVTDGGWIVLSGPPDIEVGGANPTLEFGGLGGDQPFVLFFPGACESWPDAHQEISGVMVELSDDFAAWCDPGGMMRIHVYFTGEPTFVEQLVRDLRVRDVRLAA